MNLFYKLDLNHLIYLTFYSLNVHNSLQLYSIKSRETLTNIIDLIVSIMQLQSQYVTPHYF